MNFVSNVLIAGGSVIVAGCICAAIYGSVKKKPKGRYEESHNVSGNASGSNDGAGRQDASTQNPSVGKNSGGSVLPARPVMRNNIGRFSDLLEPMYLVSRKQFAEEDAKKVFGDWDSRISGLEYADRLIEKWNMIVGGYQAASWDALCNAAVRWVNQLATYGISRDDRSALQVSRDTLKAYASQSGENLNVGDKMYVRTPAWYIDNFPIRQGVLARERQDYGPEML